MTLQIELADIEKAVAAAIIDSTLGETLRETILFQIIRESAEKRRSMVWVCPGSVLEKAIKVEVQEIVLKMIRDEYANALKEAFSALMTEAFTKEVVRRVREAIGEYID